MFDVLSDAELRALIAVTSPHCVSLYLPTHEAGSRAAQDPIRLKNLVARAKQELEDLGAGASDIAALLGPVESIVDDAGFWAHSTPGLAVFVSEEGVQRFRLAGPVAEAVVVSDRFWIAPLVPFVASGGSFHVLALSENQVRFLRGSRYEVTELGLGDIPASLADALPFDDREAQLHSHGSDRVGAGRVSATFHGHGGASDFGDVDLVRFLQLVDRGLADLLGDASAPLVLAGVDEIVSWFRKLSHHKNIAESYVGGNPERLSPEELHDRALPLVASDLDADRLRAYERFDSSAATVQTLPEALEAASGGRVADLFVLSGSHIWGSCDAEGRLIEQGADRRAGDHDLIDLTIRETLGHGGAVFAVDASGMPTDAAIAAVLRY